MMKIGDNVMCVTTRVSGVVVKQYHPTVSEQQTMIICNDGCLYHAPTRLFKVLN